MSKTDQAEKERNTLYDYFVIRFGIRPYADYNTAFEKVCINSKDGKRYRMIIDAAINLTETMFHSKDDYEIAETVAKHLYNEIEKKK